MKDFENVLIYVGGHKGNGVSFYTKDYEKVFIFEANPHFCEHLNLYFKNQSNVTVINAAVCHKHNVFVEFYISDNNGDSSSLLKANEENDIFSTIKSTHTLIVPTVNLINFLEEKNIKSVKTYISDLQGCDFLVLKTLEPLISNKLIETIQCEVGKNDKKPIYLNEFKDRQNYEDNFETLLSKNYDKISTGWGVLEDYKFENVPETWCEHDVKWKVKKE